jgi:RNA recognition motif-containing protein
MPLPGAYAPYTPQPQREATLNVYVKNLVSSVTEENLIAAFEPFGTVHSAKVCLVAFIFISTVCC